MNADSIMWMMMASRGCPFFSYIAKKKKGIITAIIPITAELTLNAAFNKKNDGTPARTAIPKHISCLFVRLNITLLFTFVRSLGTLI